MLQTYRLIGSFWLWCFFTQGAVSKTVTGITEPWPPWMDSSLENNGFLPEVLDHALKKVNHKLEFSFCPWARCIKSMQEGKDNILLGVYKTEEREKFLMFSSPVAVSEEVLFKKKGSPIKWKKLTDLSSYTIGVVRGASNGKEFDSADFLKKEPVTEGLQNVKKLVHGRIDLIAGPREVLLYKIRLKIPEMAGKIEQVGKPLSLGNLYFGFSSHPKVKDSNRKLLADFEKGFDMIKKDGTFEKLIKKHKISSALK